MKARYLLLAIGLLVLVAFSRTGEAVAFKEVQYERVENGAKSVLTLQRSGGVYTVQLDGGGSGKNGAATAGDCSVKASGARTGDQIKAYFQAVESETMSYSAADAKKEGRQMTLKAENSGIEVLRADTDGYCGLGADFVGHYRLAL